MNARVGSMLLRLKSTRNALGQAVTKTLPGRALCTSEAGVRRGTGGMTLEIGIVLGLLLAAV
ncbi:MAG TPA: hypothetical protein QF478_07265, partial [Verrucomicrobiota bacterium]|nr:hypothetical protein [Verrucomicrobiota bacterium]